MIARLRANLPVVAVCALLVIADVVWMAQDRRPPSYDQSNYLHVAWDFVGEARHHLTGLPHLVMTHDPGHGPLYPLLIAVPMLLFGPHPACALLVSVIALVGLIVASVGIAVQLAGRRAAVPAAILVGTAPQAYGLSREVLVDLTLAALCTAAVLAALRCNRFSSLRWSILLGLFLGLACLTKVTAPIQVGVAIAVALAVRADDVTVAPRDRVRNAAAGAGTLFITTAWWYIPNWSATKYYVRSTTVGEASLGAGPGQPLRWAAIKSYLLGIAQQPLAWVSIFVAIIALALLIADAVRRRSERRDHGPGRPSRAALLKTAVILTWVAVPVAFQAASHNQDTRLIAPGLVGFGVGVAIAISRIRADRARVGLVTLAAVLGGWGVLTHSTTAHLRPPLLPGDIAFPTPLGRADLALDGRTVSYARQPQHDDPASPVVRWLLEQRAARHLDRPVVLGLVQTHNEINGNTLSWLDVRDDDGMRLVITQAEQASLTPKQVDDEIATFDVVGIVPDIAGDPASGLRGTLIDQELVRADDPRITTQFTGTTATFPIDAPGTELVLHWRGTAPTHG